MHKSKNISRRAAQDKDSTPEQTTTQEDLPWIHLNLTAFMYDVLGSYYFSRTSQINANLATPPEDKKDDLIPAYGFVFDLVDEMGELFVIDILDAIESIEQEGGASPDSIEKIYDDLPEGTQIVTGEKDRTHPRNKRFIGQVLFKEDTATLWVSHYEDVVTLFQEISDIRGFGWDLPIQSLATFSDEQEEIIRSLPMPDRETLIESLVAHKEALIHTPLNTVMSDIRDLYETCGRTLYPLQKNPDFLRRSTLGDLSLMIAEYRAQAGQKTSEIIQSPRFADETAQALSETANAVTPPDAAKTSYNDVFCDEIPHDLSLCINFLVQALACDYDLPNAAVDAIYKKDIGFTMSVLPPPTDNQEEDKKFDGALALFFEHLNTAAQSLDQAYSNIEDNDLAGRMFREATYVDPEMQIISGETVNGLIDLFETVSEINCLHWDRVVPQPDRLSRKMNALAGMSKRPDHTLKDLRLIADGAQLERSMRPSNMPDEFTPSLH